MKPNPLDVAAPTLCLFATWFSAICLAAFLTVISGSATADTQTNVGELNPAEQWVVTQLRAGEIADLRKQFPEEGDRQLSADFLETLLMGSRPDVKLHRHGVRIRGACIEEPIDLTNAQIPYEVSLENCQFKSNVSFLRASFTGLVAFDNSTFKADARFASMKVGDIAVFNEAVFEGPVYFVSAHIAGDFEADGSQFKNAKQVAGFNSIKVGHSASFRNAVFEGPVDFVSAEIVSNFDASAAQFKNTEKNANFYGMKVGGAAVFTGARFEGPVNLSFSNFAELELSYSAYHGALYLQGMSYKEISAAPEESKSLEALLKLANRSVYSADVYGNLEEFFLRHGHRGHADRTFIERKRRERKENLHDLPRFGSWLLDLLVGYGRHPWQAGWFCLAIIGIGCVLFPLEKMELQDPENRTKPEKDRPRYNRFWYSLGLFLPVVDLKTSDVWGPKKQYRFLRNYLRVHILLGWILFPIFLAAITGLIR